MTKHPPRKPTNERTSPRVARLAGKALADPKTPKPIRSIAASDLTQARNRKSSSKR